MQRQGGREMEKRKRKEEKEGNRQYKDLSLSKHVMQDSNGQTLAAC